MLRYYEVSATGAIPSVAEEGRTETPVIEQESSFCEQGRDFVMANDPVGETRMIPFY